MRKLTSLVAALLLSVAAFAQAPQGFSYQAVVRDAQNAIVANQTVDVTLTLKAEIKSIPVQTYTEKHSVKTNANGLLTLVVGQGESSQKFSDFKWNLPEAIYNLETVTPYGTGTTQLLSVPYALYAEQAGNIDYAKLLSSLNVNDLSTILGLADYLKQADIQNLLATYALKTEIPTEVNLSAYAKTADVDSIYAKKTDIPTAVNLSGYATKDTLNNFALKTSLASDYVTKETFENYVLSGGNAEAVDLSVYAKTADVAATYATKAKLNDTLKVYAKTVDIENTYATQDALNDKANKSEMSIVKNDDAGTAEITLKEGTSATVLTAHQSLATLTEQIETLQNQLTELQNSIDLSAYAQTADMPKTITVTVNVYQDEKSLIADNTTIKLFNIEYKSTGTHMEPIVKVYKVPAYSFMFLTAKRADNIDNYYIKVNGEVRHRTDILGDSDAYLYNGFGSAFYESNFADRMFLLFRNQQSGKYEEKWIFALPGEDCTIDICTWRRTL